MKKGDLLKKIISFSRLLPVVLFFFTGCEQLTWDAPVHEFFEYYTSTAALVDCVINRSIGSGSVGIECVESSDKQSVSLLLRNPQRYKLDFTYNFDSSLVASKASSFSSPVTFVQSDSRDSVTIYFSKDFLYSIDNGDACSTDSLGNTTAISKDLSGTIIIKEAATQREFESFHVSVMVNSIPPRIRGAMYQTTAASGGGTEYVICFYAAKIAGIIVIIYCLMCYLIKRNMLIQKKCAVGSAL